MPHEPLTIDDLRALGRQRAGGVALGDGLAGVLGVLHGHAFDGPRSCPSQELMARELGLSREWVNALCQELRALGLIVWTRRRRHGAQWAHNRYRLRHWRPAGTARMLALLERIRGARPRPLHTETTTTAPRTTRAVSNNPYECALRPIEPEPPPPDPPPAIAGADRRLARDLDAIRVLRLGAGLYEPTFEEVPWPRQAAALNVAGADITPRRARLDEGAATDPLEDLS